MGSMAPHTAPVHTSAHRGEIPPASLPPASLWEAFRLAIFARGATKVAHDSGLSEKDLYRWSTDPMNLSGEHRRPLADAVVPITKASGSFAILDWMEAEVGRVAVSRARVVGTPSTLLASIAALTREFGDVQEICADSLRDEVLTMRAARAVEQQLTELVQQAERLRLTVVQLALRDRRPLARAGAR